MLAEHTLRKFGDGEISARGFFSAGAWDEPFVVGLFGNTMTTQNATTTTATKQPTVAFHRAERAHDEVRELLTG